VREHLAVAWPVVHDLTKIGVPAAMQVLVETASWLGLVRIISTYGSLAVAGYTIAMRIALFALLPPWGLATAAATLVGQNLGANEPERARRTVWTIAGYNLAILAPVGLAFALAPKAAIAFFTDDPTTTLYAADCLRIVAVGFIVFAFGMVAVQAFNGAGDTKTPMIVNIVSFWFIKLPLAWLLAKVVGLGPHGVFLAITIAYAIQGVLAGALFQRGSWAKVSAPRAPATPPG
jgi:putative MATE family efflux protein